MEKEIPLTQNEMLFESRFNEIRNRCGGIWHISTPGTFQEIIFTDSEDFKFGMSCMALTKAETGVMLIIDTLMNNHIHVMVGGSLEQSVNFVVFFRKRLARYLKSKGRTVDLSSFSCEQPVEVTDVRMARNVIAYIARNGYVANRNYHPFSYPWGSSSIYFNPYAQDVTGKPFNQITYVEKRNVMFSRMREYPKEYQYRNGVILPNSYCDYKLGEGLFLNPHQYFSLLMKNVESYKEIASSIAESVSLTDEEVYSTAMMIAEKNYGSRKLNLLSPAQKIELAKTLHYDYHTPNAQLRRILKLSDSILNSLWPLSALANQ